MMMERARETETHSPDPSHGNGDTKNIQPQRARESGESSDGGASSKKRGRPKNRWRIRVVRIDAQKYGMHLDREHPFATLAAEARTEEIDVFCARLWARTQKSGTVSDDRNP